MQLSSLDLVCGPSNPMCRLPSSRPSAPTTNLLRLFNSTCLYPVGHKNHWARAALSSIPTALQICSGSHRARVSPYFLHVSSTHCSTFPSAWEMPALPTPPRPTCKDLPLVLGCHFCQRFCNTSGGGVLTPRCQHYYHLGGCKQLQTDRQLPWHSGLAGRDFMEEKLKPGFSSSRRLTEGVLLSSEHWRLGWSDSRAWPQSHHSNEVFLAWCQLHHRHKPAFQRGRVRGAGGTCWTALLTFPISKDESTGPVQSTAQELLISSSASKWPTSWLKYDGDFNHCFCSSLEKTLHSN